ncbi:MAG TPA: hypothetical protein VHD83_00545 [Puia sp.]|nr:hypothetical protein [Puia sp.]
MTHFEFSKELHPRYSVEGFGILENWKVYKIRQGEKHIGEFYYHRKICFFEFGDKEMGIKIRRLFFLNTRAAIVNRKTEEEVGKIVVYNWRWGRNPLGYMQLGDVTYTGLKLKSEVKTSILKPRTWNHRKYSVFNSQEAVAYAFRPTAGATSAFIDGKITLTGDNLLLLFTGLFLVEEQLDREED